MLYNIYNIYIMYIYIYIICIYSSCLVQIIALYTPVIYTYYKNIGNQNISYY